jgi:hypothetical protein
MSGRHMETTRAAALLLDLPMRNRDPQEDDVFGSEQVPGLSELAATTPRGFIGFRVAGNG